MYGSQNKIIRRLIVFALCSAMVLSCLPVSKSKAASATMLGSLSIKAGQSKPIVLNGVNESSVVWSSSNKKIATVTTSAATPTTGTVKAKKAGKVKIYAKCLTIGKTYGVYLTVTGGKSVSLNKTSLVLTKGKSGKLKLNNAKASKVKWKTKNKKIATVSKKGVVKAKKKGKTTITANYKKKTYKCKVTVNQKAKSVSIKTLSKKKRTVTAKSNKAVSVGNLKKDGYKVTIPAGAFDKNTKVKVYGSGKNLYILAPGKKYVRLNEPVKIQLNLTGKVANSDVDAWKGVYLFGKQKDYLDPDIGQLKKGVLTFETVHFSGYTGDKLSEQELQALVSYRDAVNTISKDCQNNLMGSALEAGLGKVVEQLGFDKDSPQKAAILKQLGKSTKLIELIRAGAEGDESAFAGKAAEAITEVLIENADSSKLGYLGAAVGSIPEALQAIKNEDYSGASAAVLKAVTSNIPYVKVAQFTISVCETSITYYVDSETEAAYKAYYKMLKDGESGYSMKSGGDGWAIIEQQMAAPLRQMNDKAIKEYAAAKGVSTWSLSAAEQDQIRAMVKNNLITQFEYRYAHQTDIENRKAETQNLLSYVCKEGLMNRGDLSIGFHDDDDYQMRLTRVLNLRDAIKSMLGGKDMVDLENAGGYIKSDADRMAYNNKIYAKLIGIWIENGWTAGGNGVKGRAAVAKYLAQTYGVGVSLKPSSTNVEVGGTVQLTLIGAYGKGSWITGNKNIATVDSNGLVTGVKEGTVTITASYGKRNFTCTVKVNKKQEAEDPNTVKIKGKEEGYIYTNNSNVDCNIYLIGSAYVKGSPVTWSVSGPGATITASAKDNSSATLHMTQEGELTITAAYNGKKYVCTMIVKKIPNDNTEWSYFIDLDKLEW